MALSKKNYLNFAAMGKPTIKQMLTTVIMLSIPAILAQLTSVVMQYIDAAMVGNIGADASASIGLVSTTTWLLSGLCSSLGMGFSVQIAQLVGAGRDDDARSTFRQGIVLCLSFGLLICAVALCISPHLPTWLGGEQEIKRAASRYFFVYALSLPSTQMRMLFSSSLQCSGDMKTPSFLNIMMCFLDVVFNFIFIYPTRVIGVFGFEVTIFGAGLGVMGAAIGTALADYVTMLLMMLVCIFKSDKLSFRLGGNWKIRKNTILTALRISIPSAFEHVIMCTGYICSTLIIAPLGTVPVAAHSLAVTAESFCYMPGYGIGSASTTIVGQSIGAGRRDIAKRFSWCAVLLGVSVMTFMGFLMFFGAEFMFLLLSSDTLVRSLGADILKIEAFAEPLYAASIVCTGALRGAGDTLVPGILNLVSMWGVRITLSLLLVPNFGLYGVWIAMALELCFRGIIYLVILARGKWLSRQVGI